MMPRVNTEATKASFDHIIRPLFAKDFRDQVGDQKGQGVGQQAHTGLERVPDPRGMVQKKNFAEDEVAVSQARDKQAAMTKYSPNAHSRSRFRRRLQGGGKFWIHGVQ